MFSSNDQYKELERICESPILRKLELSEKFPRRIMYTEKSNYGLGLMRPKTIANMMAVKLHVGNMRLKSNVSEIIKANKQMAHLSSERTEPPNEIAHNDKWLITTWVDKVMGVCEERNIEVNVQ